MTQADITIEIKATYMHVSNLPAELTFPQIIEP